MIELERYAYCPTHTEGVLRVGSFECFTIERPWLGNIQGRSCVPEGMYEATLDVHHGTAGDTPYECVELLGVPGRDQIQVHIANWVHQLRGCIALGCELGVLDGERAALRAKKAFDAFMIQVRAQPMRLQPAGILHFPFRIGFRNRYGVMA